MREFAMENNNSVRKEPFISDTNAPIVEDIKEPTFVVDGDSVMLEKVVSTLDQVEGAAREDFILLDEESEKTDSEDIAEKIRNDSSLINLHRLGSMKKEQKIINLKKDIENLKIANRSKFLADTALNFETSKLQGQISWFEEGIKLHQKKIAEIEQGQNSSFSNQELESVDRESATNIIDVSGSELEANIGVSELVNKNAVNNESYDYIDTPRYTIGENNVVNLDRSQWNQVDREESFDTEQEKLESSTEEIEMGASEKNEEITEKNEYLRLKGEFKTSQREYMQVLEEDYKNRGVLKKVFGLGRKEMSPEVQVAYDKFMEANTAYYGFAQESGVYQKIAERINRDRLPEEQTALGSAVMGRHVFRPAEERLELQTSHMPEGLINLKKKIIGQVKKHPRVAVAVGAALLVKSAVFSLPALLTGLGTRYAGKRFGDALEGGLSDDKKEMGYLFDEKNELVSSPEIGINLTELEEEIFSKANRLQKVRTGTNWVAAGAGLAAGGVSSFANAEDGFLAVSDSSEVVPSDVVSDLQDNINFESVIDSSVEATEVQPVENIEGMFFLGRGDNLSSALLNQLREQVETGSLQLPKGVELDNLSHYIYQSFPEMTSATGVSPRLSPEEWVKLGISSGDPHNIQVGEGIDMQGLINKMWGMPQDIPSPDSSAESVINTGVESVASNQDGTLYSAVGEQIQQNTTPEVAEIVSPRVSSDVESSLSESVVPSEVSEPVSVVEDQDSHVSSATESAPATETVSKTFNNNVEAATRSEILAGRRGSFEAARMLEDLKGYQPKMNPNLEHLVTTPNPDENIIHHVYEHMIRAYQAGDMNLPAERMAYVAGNKTALYSFIEETALELSDKKWSAALGGGEPLGLTPAEWQELGFSSGDPQNVVAGDQIQMGKLIKVILEHSAEDVNNKNLYAN